MKRTEEKKQEKIEGKQEKEITEKLKEKEVGKKGEGREKTEIKIKYNLNAYPYLKDRKN